MIALLFLAAALVLYAFALAWRYPISGALVVWAFVLVPGAALADGGATVLLSPQWLPVVLTAGALLLKTVMSLLDKVGALDHVPPYLKPLVTGGFAAVVALLEHLGSGGDLPRAALVALAAFAGNELLHHTVKGVRKAKAKGAP